MIAESDMLNETIRTQHAEIERLSGQRDRLMKTVKDLIDENKFNRQEAPEDFMFNVTAEFVAVGLIAEIEAEK